MIRLPNKTFNANFNRHEERYLNYLSGGSVNAETGLHEGTKELPLKMRNKYSQADVHANLIWVKLKKNGGSTSNKADAINIVNVTGAGDTLVGGLAYFFVVEKYSFLESVIAGMEAAVLTLWSDRPVNPELSVAKVLGEDVSRQAGVARL